MPILKAMVVTLHATSCRFSYNSFTSVWANEIHVCFMFLKERKRERDRWKVGGYLWCFSRVESWGDAKPGTTEPSCIKQPHPPVFLRILIVRDVRITLRTLVGSFIPSNLCKSWRLKYANCNFTCCFVVYVSGPKREEVAGGWRRLHNKELRNLHASPNFIRMIKSGRMILACHVARMGTRKMRIVFCFENLKGRDYLEDLCVDEVIILEWILGN
jgi:hypothetical protein